MQEKHTKTQHEKKSNTASQPASQPEPGRLAGWLGWLTKIVIYVTFGSFLGPQNHPNHYMRKVWELFGPPKSPKSLYT